MAQLWVAVLLVLGFITSNASAQDAAAPLQASADSGSSTMDASSAPSASITSVAASVSTTPNEYDTLMAVGFSILTSAYVDGTTTSMYTVTSFMTTPSASVSSYATTTASSSLSTGSASGSGLVSAAATSSVESSPSSEVPSGGSDRSKRNMGIILGTVLGLFAVGVAVAILCVRHRRRKTGTFFAGRAVTPLDDAEFASWRQPLSSTVHSSPSTGHSNRTPEKPPAAAFSARRVSTRSQRHYSGGIVQVENPFDTPRYTYRPRTTSQSTLDHTHEKKAHMRADSIASLNDRPPTPYSPASTRPRGNSGSKLINSPTSSRRPTLDDG